MRIYWHRVIIFVLTIPALVWVHTLAGPTTETLPPCPTEDAAGPCYWDAPHMGNSEGQSFRVGEDGSLTYYK